MMCNGFHIKSLFTALFTLTLVTLASKIIILHQSTITYHFGVANRSECWINIKPKEAHTTCIEKKNPIIWNESYNFILNNQKMCSSRSIFLIIFVHSACHHFNTRRHFRDTWVLHNKVHPGGNIKTVFIVGVTNDMNISRKLTEESVRYKDIIQGNFIDSYKNLTIKHVTGLKWITMYCNKSEFVLKLDDDSHVDMAILVKFLLSNKRNMTNQIFCDNIPRARVHRNPKSKWYVLQTEYLKETYPSYCHGYAYITTPTVVQQLYELSIQEKIFWIDDVYVTGIIGGKINVTLSNSVYPYTFRCFKRKNKSCLFFKNHYKELS